MILAIALLAVLPPGEEGAFLFREGSRWSYAAKVEYTLPHSNRVQSLSTAWEMAVLLARHECGLSASVIRGWVDQLPWFEPGRQPTESVAICAASKVYIVARQKNDPSDLVRAGPTAWRKAVKGLEPKLVFPLRVGAHWAAVDGDRDDGFYRWNVERVSRQRVVGRAPTEVFRLRYQSHPEHQILDIAPATGVVAYEYDHHGTVSHVELRLLGFKPPAE